MRSTIPGKLVGLCLAGALVLFAYSPASAQQLAELKESGLRVVLSKKGADFEVAIAPDKSAGGLTKELTANVFAIENPTRLVIDIPNHKAKGTHALAINNPVFTSLRVGQHPDKVRIVFDVKDNRQLNYNISSDAKRQALLVDVSFGAARTPAEEAPAAEENREPESVSAKLNLEGPPPPAEEAAPPKTPIKNKKEQPAAEPPPEPASADFAFDENQKQPPQKNGKPSVIKEEPPLNQPPAEQAEEEESEWEAPPPPAAKAKPQEMVKPREDLPVAVPPKTENKVPIESPEEAQESLKNELALQTQESPGSSAPIITNAAKINGIYYQSPKDSNVSAVQIDVDAHNTYSLTQRDNNRFELIINNAALAGPHLALPQFPPDTFTGFEVILARNQGKDVVVNIYVEDGVKLSPFIAKGKLWLKVNKQP